MVKFDRQGLIPVVIQDEATNEVLMVAFMNEEALQRTRETGYTHFYSRSRGAIWHKGEQSGNVQEVRTIHVNCEENSLLVRVMQHGGAACHEGYRSCYYRRLLPDDSYEYSAERVFNPDEVYGHGTAMPEQPLGVQKQVQELEQKMRQLYDVYLYLRDHDMSTQSNTSRLLQEKGHAYLTARLADEIEELAGVQRGEHLHSGKQADTVLESSQVGYWLLLIAATNFVRYEEMQPHQAIWDGYNEQGDAERAIEMQQECLSLVATAQHEALVRGLREGFLLVGWACAQAGIDPQRPTEFDLEQMRRKGLVE